MATTTQSPVTQAHKDQFERDGFFVLEQVVPQQHLEILRSEVGAAIARIDAEMEEKGVERLGINSKNSRYFVQVLNREPNSPVAEFVFSELMADVCHATLGQDAFLFYDQYVVKSAERGESFSWHQDSGYVGFPEHKPYLTCWVTLDDVSQENGTVYILPYDRAGTRDYVQHSHDASNNDMTGYFGDDPGIPIIAPAGSIACFSSTVFHLSGANQTDKMRRVYLPQYSAEPLVKPNGSLLNMAVPFVRGGEQVKFGAK